MASNKLSDRVYEYILDQLIAGAFPVNTRLPTEFELAQRLSVSRPVVRDALQRLREEGLLASRHRCAETARQRDCCICAH
jgi:GntR family transcriptional regulator, transcriptional repressor for pyruvate dehydrogenase complex